MNKSEKIEELEQQLAYENECNKQFVACQNKLDKLADYIKELEERKGLYYSPDKPDPVMMSVYSTYQEIIEDLKEILKSED